MKRFLLVLAVATIVAVSVGQASAFDWVGAASQDAYYKSQTWNFALEGDLKAVTSTAGPLALTGIGNEASLAIASTTHTTALWQSTIWDKDNNGHQGGWLLTGSNATNETAYETVATFTVPQAVGPAPGHAQLVTDLYTNVADAAASLQILATKPGGGVTYDCTMTADAVNTLTGYYRLNLQFPDTPGGLAAITSPLLITVGSKLPTGAWVAFDSVTINTVPEPGTVAMLIAGALALLGWAGRRWIRK